VKKNMEIQIRRKKERQKEIKRKKNHRDRSEGLFLDGFLFLLFLSFTQQIIGFRPSLRFNF
jgi:hypothetical protein